MKKLLCFFIAAVAVCCAVPQGAARASEGAQGPVASWTFDDADEARISDRTGSGYDLKINTELYELGRGYERNAVWFTQTGETNTSKRMEFGENGIEAALKKQAAVTFQCMFKKRFNVNSLGEKDLFSLYFTSGKAALRIYLKDSQIGVASRASNDEPSMSTVTAPLDLADETRWYQLSVSMNYAQKTTKIYVDGGLYLNAEMPGWTKDYLDISGHSVKNGLGCDAVVLDNAALYLRELSAEEVRNSAPPAIRLDMWDGSNVYGGDPVAVFPDGVRNESGIAGLIKAQGDLNQFAIKNGGLGKRLTEARPTGVSIGMWVRGPLPETQKTLFRVMNTAGVAAMDIKLDGNAKIEYGGRSDGDEASGREAYSSSAAELDWDEAVWHFILCATDYAEQKRYIYFDGSLVAEAGTSYRKDAYENGYSASKSDVFGIEGMAVDGLTVYSRVLSEDEMLELMHSRPVINLIPRGLSGELCEPGSMAGGCEAAFQIYNSKDLPISGVFFAALTNPETNQIKELQKATVGEIQPGAELAGSVWFDEASEGDEIRYYFWDSLSSRIRVTPQRTY